jgi:quercetin dioxygenase-like cupin family protein
MGLVGETEPRNAGAKAAGETARTLFEERGYPDPVRVLSSEECEQLRGTIAEVLPETPDWHKGNAGCSRAFYEAATHHAVIDLVTSLLGEDVLLWGASVISRAPGAVHPWHSDIESSSAPPGKTVSVWMGLRHTTHDSSLLVIPYSHRFGITVQEARSRVGRKRGEIGDEEILAWARERDGRSRIVNPELTDGEAIAFDGRIWHGSRNTSEETREALLLQYCTPDVTIRIPDLTQLDWPFRYRKFKRPGCIVVSGTAARSANRIVAPPSAGNGPSTRRLTSRSCPLRIPLAPDNEKGWKPYPILEGQTARLGYISCHASVLSTGHSPHPPHKHNEEELLLLLAGEVDLILPAQKRITGSERKRLRPGQFVYYPANFAHTLETISQTPANYLMFKWLAGSSGAHSRLPFGQFDASSGPPDTSAEAGFRMHVLFEGATDYLHKLHCHASTLAPGAGYEPHADPYDVGIVVLEGEIETLGKRATAHDVIFCTAGEFHGMRNTGDCTVKYIVFEFHGSRRGWAADDASFFRKLRDPQRVKRKLRSIARGFFGSRE